MSDWTDFLVIFAPIVIAAVIYILVYGPKKSVHAVASKSEHEVSLSEGRPIVTITANHILLDDNLQMDRKTRSALEILTDRAVVFVFVVVADLEEQRRIEADIAQVFSGVVPEGNILYCQTAMGRAYMSRQLAAVAHFDFDLEVIHQVSIFYKSVLIAPKTVESQHASWHAESFSDFMTSGNTDFLDLLRSS